MKEYYEISLSANNDIFIHKLKVTKETEKTLTLVTDFKNGINFQSRISKSDLNKVNDTRNRIITDNLETGKEIFKDHLRSIIINKRRVVTKLEEDIKILDNFALNKN